MDEAGKQPHGHQRVSVRDGPGAQQSRGPVSAKAAGQGRRDRCKAFRRKPRGPQGMNG